MATDIVERTITVTAIPRPKLGLQTPKTSTFPTSALEVFPSELSARTASARSPLKGFGDFIKQELDLKTPITPPLAYTDFLKALSPLHERMSGASTPSSAASTASSMSSYNTDCSYHHEKSKSPVSSLSSEAAKPASSASRPDLSEKSRSYSSTAIDIVESPSGVTPAIRSAMIPTNRIELDVNSTSKCSDTKSPRTSNRVRHVREIVTRTTVTYVATPRMSAAPKGKRRKIEESPVVET